MKHEFQKGVSGNPHGRPILPDDLKGIKKLSKEEHIRIVSKLIRFNKEEFTAVLKSENTLSMHELMIAKCMMTCLSKGDINIYEKIMDRLIGKVPTPISGVVGNPIELKDVTDDARNKILSKFASIAAAIAANGTPKQPV